MSYPRSQFFDQMGKESTQLHETPKAQAAFLIYCTMGQGRTLSKVVTQMGAKPSYLRILKEWSGKYRWQERVKQYDLETAQEELRQAEKELKKMNEKHAASASAAQLTALEYVHKLIKNNKLGSIAAVQWLKNSFDLERLARGGSTEAATVKLTGPDGGAIVTDSTVRVYLPQKDPAPGIITESGDVVQALPVPETAESLKQRLARQVAAYLHPKPPEEQ